MSFSMKLWENAQGTLVEVPKHTLDTEERLEEWIEKDVGVLGLDVLIIGRQITSPYRGRLDLLALDSQGAVVIIELKRDRTPREVVAQTLDYASWIHKLTPRDIVEIGDKYKHFPNGLAKAFFARFNQEMPDELNASHRMVIVASELDDSSERIVQYLSSQHSLDINVVFFNCFIRNGVEFIGRSWLMDPVEVEQRSESRNKASWSGYWFVNLGEGEHRCWDDCRTYGFVSAGQGRVYSDPLKRLQEGDKIFAYLKSNGYVGYGVVQSEAQLAKSFIPIGFEKRLFELPLVQDGIKSNADDPDMSDWVVAVKWIKTFPSDKSQKFKGVFANPNIVCKLRDPATVEFLKTQFEITD